MYKWRPQNEKKKVVLFLKYENKIQNVVSVCSSFLFSSLWDSLILSQEDFYEDSPLTYVNSVNMLFPFFPCPSSPFCRRRPPLLLRLWYEPMWQEGVDVAEQRVRCLRPGPVGDCRKHRLLALPGGGCYPSPQPEHRDTHVPPLWPLEGVLLGWWVSMKSEIYRSIFIPQSIKLSKSLPIGWWLIWLL